MANKNTPPKGRLTHLNDKGHARMVDVSSKPPTRRSATASCNVYMQPETLKMVVEGKAPKGDVFATARVAGIMAAKKTPELIPMCHPLNITSVSLDLIPLPNRNCIRVIAEVSSMGPTGVEMEALTAASAAALCVYDMCKAVERGIRITDLALDEKYGGKSGHYKRSHPREDSKSTRPTKPRPTKPRPTK